jgi:Tol biopolymer transport system component
MSAAAFFRRPAVVLILGLCLIGIGVSVLGRLVTGPAAEPKRVPLPHAAGAEATPAFSPDGRRLAFSAREGDRTSPYHVYVRTLGAGGAAVQLTSGPADDFGPAWSPDGASIAFLRMEGERARYMVLPAAGGEPRPVADFTLPGAAPGDCRMPPGEVEARGACGARPDPQSAVGWARDGQSLYVVVWSADQPPYIAAVPAAGGAPRRITQPPAGSYGDSSPAISPDGATLAFVRQSAGETEQKRGRGKFAPVRQSSSGDESEGSDVFLSDVSGGGARRLTFDNASIHGIAWSTDGRDVIYAARRLGQDKLWRIAASGGSSRNVLASGKHPASPAVAPAGHHLAFIETPALDRIWRIDLNASDPASSARLLIGSNHRELAPSWSPGGTRIANVSTESGSPEVWVGDADGSRRKPITHLNAPWIEQPRWSPDGRAVLFAVRGPGNIDVNRVNSDGRTPPQHIPLPGDAHQLSFSHDGSSVYFVSMAQIWKALVSRGNQSFSFVDGQQRQKLSNNWGDEQPEESADGQYVFFRRERAVWRVPVSGGTEEKVFEHEPETHWIAYQPTTGGLYYLERDRDERTVSLSFYGFAGAKSRELVRLPVADPSSVSAFSVSADGRYLLYPAVDRTQTSLVLTEDFR